MLNPEQLLTVEESAQVDAALMTSQDRFSTRMAIYALRVIRSIAQAQGMRVEAVGRAEIQHFLAADESMQAAIAAQGMELDPGFERFWTQLILSALRPLNEAAAIAGHDLETLSLENVIAWFEQQSKAKLQG